MFGEHPRSQLVIIEFTRQMFGRLLGTVLVSQLPESEIQSYRLSRVAKKGFAFELNMGASFSSLGAFFNFQSFALQFYVFRF